MSELLCVIVKLQCRISSSNVKLLNSDVAWLNDKIEHRKQTLNFGGDITPQRRRSLNEMKVLLLGRVNAGRDMCVAKLHLLIFT